MRIFGWAADNAGPAHYRLRVPFGALEQQGWTTNVNTTMPDRELEEADTIVGQRVCQPGATERWRRLAAGHYGRRPQLVFEIDDDLWHIDPTNTPAWSFYQQPGLLDNLTECARLADVCTVSTEPLAEVVRKINPNVVVLPNQLPPAAFAPASNHGGHRLEVGWAGGASHAADVDEMVPGLRTFFRRHPLAVFVNLGTVFGPVVTAIPGAQRIMLPWTTDMDQHYDRLAASMNVGLAPLRPSVFNQSKSDIKFLEYSAAGAATIATDHGPYAATIRGGETGVLVRQMHEWATALRFLSDPAERAYIASNALAYARTRSIDTHWQEWDAVYTI